MKSKKNAKIILLDKNKIYFKSWIYFLELLKINNSLLILSLSKNFICDEGAK